MLLPRLTLASRSPRRAELLRSAGFDFDVLTGDVDESRLAGEGPEEYVRRLAREKASVCLGRTDRPVLGADTIVLVEGAVFGKPRDREDAAHMLRELSGRRHRVMTGVALVGRQVSVDVETTAVEFTPLSEAEIAWYVSTGEPDDKAGGYAVQGLASRFVSRIEGSYSNVVGLPVALVYRLLLREAGPGGEPGA